MCDVSALDVRSCVFLEDQLRREKKLPKKGRIEVTKEFPIRKAGVEWISSWIILVRGKTTFKFVEEIKLCGEFQMLQDKFCLIDLNV